ncbi:MAG: histidinol-phosphatase, partial [Bauldia sp.]|nr:histidinol-phosphatase [Bauldia sp.]
VRLARYGSDCYGYCMVAAGNADVVVECGLQDFDVIALIPIIEGAGGRFTDWQGGSAAGGGRIVATGDPALHDKVLERLAGP